MKKPTAAQWNSLPAGTYARIGSDAAPDVVICALKAESGIAEEGIYGLYGPIAWRSLLFHAREVDLLYVPGGIPVFEPEPTLTIGGLTGLLSGFDEGMILRMMIGGRVCAPGRPFHHGTTEREVSLALAVMKLTVGDFLEQLAGHRFLDREPFSPLEITPGLPVRVRDRNDSSDDAWSITGAHVEKGQVFLDLI